MCSSSTSKSKPRRCVMKSQVSVPIRRFMQASHEARLRTFDARSRRRNATPKHRQSVCAGAVVVDRRASGEHVNSRRRSLVVSAIDCRARGGVSMRLTMKGSDHGLGLAVTFGVLVRSARSKLESNNWEDVARNLSLNKLRSNRTSGRRVMTPA